MMMVSNSDEAMACGLELLKLTMPCKTIEINQQPYLNRYFVSQDAQGTQEWLHEFVSADSELHLHSHPWKAVSIVLTGGYCEERLDVNGAKKTRFYNVGAVNVIDARTTHRITKVFPCTWTLMRVEAERLPSWDFIDELGNQTSVAGSSADWWKTASTLSGEPPLIFYPLAGDADSHIVATTISHYIEVPPCYT
ncbi:MAG: hypothetical protein EOO68_07060 [Moraxellaceae bacterium]|jgi:hypothetical protein|nr:MAG: hypothetical protein EOO68_07060 [Moraxellaceae bacterium]